MLSREATNTNFIVFGLIYRTQDEHANYYTTDAVVYQLNITYRMKYIIKRQENQPWYYPISQHFLFILTFFGALRDLVLLPLLFSSSCNCCASSSSFLSSYSLEMCVEDDYYIHIINFKNPSNELSSWCCWKNFFRKIIVLLFNKKVSCSTLHGSRGLY